MSREVHAKRGYGAGGPTVCGLSLGSLGSDTVLPLKEWTNSVDEISCAECQRAIFRVRLHILSIDVEVWELASEESQSA